MVFEAESLGLIADHPNKLHGLRVQGTSLPWYLLSCQPRLSLSMSGLCSSRARRLLTVFLGWLENLSFLHRNGHPWFQRFWVFLGLPTGFLRTQPWRCFLPAFARNLCPLMFLAFCDIPKSFTSTYGDQVFHLLPPNFGTTCWQILEQCIWVP